MSPLLGAWLGRCTRALIMTMPTPERDDLASIAHDIAHALEHEGSVRAVFGEPVKLDTRTVIPVARVAMGGGGAGVGALGAAVRTIRRWLGPKNVQVEPSRTFFGGGGGGLDVRPVGFLSEEDGRVVFTRIEDMPPGVMATSQTGSVPGRRP